MHAWAEVCHLLQSSKSPLTGFLCSIGWRITGFLQTLPAHQQYSVFLIQQSCDISLLSDLCACVHVKKNGAVKEAIVLQWAVRIASCDFKPGKKRWASALLSEKCCCFVRKPSWKSHANVWRRRRRRRKKNILGRLATFWFGAFTMLFSANWCVFRHENTRKWTIGCYNGL